MDMLESLEYVNPCDATESWWSYIEYICAVIMEIFVVCTVLCGLGQIPSLIGLQPDMLKS